MSGLARSSSSAPFPIYLLSAPFRRRRNPSTDSTSSETSAGNPPSPNACPASPNFLSGHVARVRCARCATDLCLTSQIISKGFTGRHGRAYLVSPFPIGPHPSDAATKQRGSYRPDLPNTHVHKAVPRQLATGAHTVSDVSCAFCGSVIGWKYDSAEEESQRYKVGKYILETKKTFESSCWEGEGFADGAGAHGDGANGPDAENVEFDSQDEDECEDLFAGVWSPTLALRRRQRKRFGKNASIAHWRRS